MQLSTNGNRKPTLVIETRLSQDQVRRLAILSHLQRPPFYVYATLCAALTAYVIVRGDFVLLLLAWVPFGIYLLTGVLGALRGSRNPNAAHFLPTRYELSHRGMMITTSRGQRQITWQSFTKWKKPATATFYTWRRDPCSQFPRRRFHKAM